MDRERHLEADIAVLGGGPAGYVAAIRAAQLGAVVVLIEEQELGGVCLNRGCIPTKSLLKNSEVAYLCHRSREYGVESKVSEILWQSAWSRKERVVKNLRMGLERLIAEHKISLVKGRGELVGVREVIVDTEQGTISVSYKKLIITVGSEPAIPKIPGIRIPGILTSNEALELQEVPSSLVIIGAGAIGLEFADIFSSIGSKVTVIEAEDRILPAEDQEITGELLKGLKRRGISFKLGALVQGIEQDNSGLNVSIMDQNGPAVLKADKVLLAVGRKLRAANANVLKIGIQVNDTGAIVVNEQMETNIQGVYAAGDVVGGKLLAHLAYAEGRVAAENALGNKSSVNYDAVPACVYTHPEVASVGISELEAQKRGIPVITGRFHFRHNGRALTAGEREGFVKIVVNSENHIILGGQILGYQASELISELTLAVTAGIKAEVLADLVHPHPTLSEAIMEACGDALGRSIHKIN